MKRRLLLPTWLLMGAAAAGSGLPAPIFAQEATAWDVSIPRGDTREISFTTTEGTWMSVDVAPDASWVAFDLLGHIYRLPTTGGTAQVLTQNSGIALNYQPRISPDGRMIAFVSDRGGMDNLWVMNADGSNPRIVLSDQDSRVVTPTWTPDGRHIVVRREPTARRGAGGAGLGLWMFPIDGGEGTQLLEADNAHWPTFTPDGRHLYFYIALGGRDRDALNGDFQLQRLDIASGVVIDITSGSGHGSASGRRSSGGAFAPEVSPDGRWLAFARHIPDGTISFKGHQFGPRTALWLLDLETGEERLVLDPITPAVESHDKNLRVIPGYDWSADGSSIFISTHGGISRLDLATGASGRIPFVAAVQRTISQQARRNVEIEEGPFEATFLRWQTASPSGETIAFQGVGRIWLSDGSGSETPRRLTPETFGPPQEFAPAWSPDGEWIAFTTWDDTLGGHLWKAPAAGGTPIRLTPRSGEYVHPAWSPDGTEVVVGMGSGATFRGRTLTHNPRWDLVRVPAAGGDFAVVTRVALPAGSAPEDVQRRAILSPSWSADGRIYFPDFTDDGTALTSALPDGQDRRVHLLLPSADEATPSPDGRWVAYQEANDVYLAAIPAMPAGGEPPLIDRQADPTVKRISRTGGLFVRWRDVGSLEYGSGKHYFVHDLSSEQTDSVALSLTVPRAIPSGSIAMTNARIVTLGGPRNDEVIESGTVVVQGGRITCVGACETAGVDEVVDASGKTIIPGFIDMHAHHHREHRGYRPLRDYEVGIYLAYGVTTNLDNSMWSQNIFPTAELIEAGRMIGPRTFSTSDPMPFEELASRDATAEHVLRSASWGATSLKQHSHPRRDRRQWIADVAREYGINVTAEGYDLEYNLGHAMDGYTGWEHPLSIIPLYSDAAQFFAQSEIVYSNPFMYNSSTTYNIEYWYAESDVWQDEKQRRWTPWRMSTFLRRRELRPDVEYSFPLVAQGLADIIAAGGHGALGGHGEHHGLSIHWEVWMAASALGPLGALKAASLGGAYFLGADQDVGSVTVGKAADFMVLNTNPLENIRNTADIQYVMKGGVLYEADTLDEVWPEQRSFGPYYWVDEDATQMNDLPIDPWSPMTQAAAGGASVE